MKYCALACLLAAGCEATPASQHMDAAVDLATNVDLQGGDFASAADGSSPHTISGTLTGLAGMLVLEDNGADDLTLLADGPFHFATPIAHGASYAVTVLTQPMQQLCTVQNGSGTALADVSDVMVSCAHTFAVGGMVSGLSGTVVLRDNGGDDLTLTADGSFSFAGRLLDGASYDVTVSTQPIGQICTVGAGAGMVAGADVSSVSITCKDAHQVGGTVSGMVVGSLLLRDNGANDLVVNYPNSSFVFSQPVAEGDPYAVTIATQPTGQHCVVSSGSGNIATSDVTDVSITCALLQVRFDEVYARPATGAFGDTNGDGVRDSNDDEFVEILNQEAFAVDVSGWVIRSGSGSPSVRYTFHAGTMLAPGQRAVIFGGGTPTGSFGGAFVDKAASLSLADSPTGTENVLLVSSATVGAQVDIYSYIKGTFPLSCSTQCQSQTRDPGTGSFVAHSAIACLQVSPSPSPCGILSSPGVAAGAAIPKIEGPFSSPAANSTDVGIQGSLTAQLNMFLEPADVDSAHVKLYSGPCASPGAEVASSVSLGDDDSMVVVSPIPDLQYATPYCVAFDGSTRSENDTPMGAPAAYQITTVNPGPTYTIGGNVSGNTSAVTLQNEHRNDLTVGSPAPFTFTTPWPDGAQYSVTVKSQPAGQFCTVGSGSGVVSGGPVNDVTVDCKNVHALGGSTAGLQAGTVTLSNNGGDPQFVSGSDGPFSFSIPVAEGDLYDVEVSAQPTGQVCTVDDPGGGVMGTSDIAVTVNCQKLKVLFDEIHPHPANGVYGDANGDGVRDTNTDEFVEILNEEVFPVDIGNWQIKLSSAVTPKMTFPGGTTLQPGQRAVVFGGGTPTGSFGGALVSPAPGPLGLTDHPSSGLDIQLLSPGSFGVDTFHYDQNTFSNSCDTDCGSMARDDTGAFKDHASLAGVGILWSPGVAPTQAIPKFNLLWSRPRNRSLASVLTDLLLQFNMFMHTADFTNANLKLYQSTCDAADPANEVMSFSSVGAGNDASMADLVPAAPLEYATTYCVAIDGAVENAVSPMPVPFGAPISFEFTTRPAQSRPASSVVISEYGGCRVSGTKGVNACNPAETTSNNDEFVELYNPTGSPIDITGWFIQERSATGSTVHCWASLVSPSPSPAIIPANGYFLVGGANYDQTHYSTNAKEDYRSATGTFIAGGAESIVLIDNQGSCTGATHIIDSVSARSASTNITDGLFDLLLPAASPGPATTTPQSLERKACYNSTAADMSGGAHSDYGNSEKIGASNADWVPRATPQPQNSSVNETYGCP